MLLVVAMDGSISVAWDSVVGSKASTVAEVARMVTGVGEIRYIGKVCGVVSRRGGVYRCEVQSIGGGGSEVYRGGVWCVEGDECRRLGCGGLSYWCLLY